MIFKTPFYHPFLLPGLHLIPISLSPPLQGHSERRICCQHSERRMGFMVSSYHGVSSAASSSGEDSFFCSSVGSFHQEKAPMIFSSVSPSHRLQSFMGPCMSRFHRVRSVGCSNLGPPTGSGILPANLLQYGLLSLGGTGPTRGLLQCGHPTGS